MLTPIIVRYIFGIYSVSIRSIPNKYRTDSEQIPNKS